MATFLTYGDYLKIPELLKLQVCQSQPAHPDEMQFIIIHQAFELWFKQILTELDRSCTFMPEGDTHSVHKALHCFRRVEMIQKLLIQQIHILESMRPVDFLYFREPLKPASGFQSTQWREIEFLSGLKDKKLLRLCFGEEEMITRVKRRMEEPTIWDAFCRGMGKRDFDLGSDAEKKKQELVRLYESPDKYPELYELAEALMNYDENMYLWRSHHVTVVERVIGMKTGTGAKVNEGYEGAKYLQSTLVKRCFPDLWDVRSHLEYNG